MNEYMLLIFNKGGSKESMTPEKHTEFVKKCEVYIGNLKKAGKLISGMY